MSCAHQSTEPVRVAAVVHVDRPQGVVLGLNEAETITVPGLHSDKRGAVIRPGARIGYADVSLRIVAMKGGFCQPPPGFGVQRQIAHCGRSSNGASARGNFARSA